MDASAFWSVIGNYNEQTKGIQVILFLFLILALAVSYTKKVNWAAKFALGIINLFIGIGFFALHGTQPVQKYFALPLYLVCGCLFLYESYHHKSDVLQKSDRVQMVLLFLYFIYPVISVLLRHSFPETVTYIMPCPIASISLVICTGYKKKNKLLLILLTVWGLTGIKSVIFHAYEDIILLVCGLYGVMLLCRKGVV